MKHVHVHHVIVVYFSSGGSGQVGIIRMMMIDYWQLFQIIQIQIQSSFGRSSSILE